MLTVMLKSLTEYDLSKSKLRSLWTKSKVVVLCYISFRVTIFYSDEEPLSKYSLVTFRLSPPTRILNENPVSFYFP